jgi:hypothetical protein
MEKVLSVIHLRIEKKWIMVDHLLKWERWNLNNHNNQYNFKLYFADEIENIKRNQFYFDPETHAIKPYINIVSRLVRTNSLNEADYIFVPHPWVSIRNNYKYKNYLINLSKKIPLLISNTDDTSPKCDLPNTLEFRTFLHPRESKYRKIIVPYPAKTKQFKLRSWKPTPTISFIGYVPKLSFGSLTSKSISFLHSPIKSSVYLNRKISIKRLESLADEFKIICIERQTFTLLQTNINLSTHIDEYEKNLLESDYILCPRGFANTSIRFYETLSSGATPILINSGTDLPELVNSKFWEKNILNVGLLKNWLNPIKKDWNNLSKDDNYTNRQLYNQQVFRNELDLHKFMEKIFSSYIQTTK